MMLSLLGWNSRTYYISRHVYCAVTELCVLEINNAPTPASGDIRLVLGIGIPPMAY